MKKIALLLTILSYYHAIPLFVHAQCAITVGGQEPNLSYCAQELPLVLEGTPAGGIFSGVGIIDSLFNPVPEELPGIFAITYTDPDGCTTFEVFDVYTADEEAEILFTPYFCTDSDTILRLSDIGNLGEDGIFLMNNQTVTTFEPSQVEPGVYEVIYSYVDDLTGCISTDIGDIIVDEPPIVDFEMPLVYCVSDPPGEITVPSDNVGTFSGPGIAVNGSTFDPQIAGLGEHEVLHTYCTFFAPDMCCNEARVTVEVIEPPAINFRSLGSSCFTDNDTILYDGDPVPETTLFDWTIEDGEQIYNGGDTLIVSWNSPGDKLVSLEIGNSSCVGSGSFSDMINASGITLTSSEDQFVNIGESVEIEANGVASSATGVVQYSWSPAASLSCNDCSNPLAFPEETTTYIVSASDGGSCLVTDSVTVTVIISYDVFIPNIFTPNDDGNNDELKIFGAGIESVNFVVYDRRSGKVFETNDASEGWTGKDANGKTLNTGVYIYVAEIMFSDPAAPPLIKKGTVTLMK